MKKGDRVWLFFPDANNSILECEVVGWPEDDAMFSYRIVGQYRERPYIGFKAACFLSREALCEFYRKIFE